MLPASLISWQLLFTQLMGCSRQLGSSCTFGAWLLQQQQKGTTGIGNTDFKRRGSTLFLIALHGFSSSAHDAPCSTHSHLSTLHV